MSTTSMMVRANVALGRLTGYRITKAARGAPTDSEMASIIQSVREYTLTNDAKLEALITSVRYIVQHDIAGDIVECGVWRGGSMQAAALTLLGLGRNDRTLYLYDTFTGMTPPTDRDVRFDGQTAKERMDSDKNEAQAIWCIADLDDVQRGFQNVRYPSDRVKFVKGRVEQTIPEQAPDTISILRLDTDFYESTAHELEHLYPRLVSGGVLILDDYDWWAGARDATDEFLKASGARLMLTQISGGRIAVKP